MRHLFSRLPGSATFCALVLTASMAVAGQPITADSRIKTLVYNPNEVYPLTTHYGFQSNIEFGPKEVIETISVGDRVAWQISPAGRRLFIRAQEENAHTNMTVVTNQRAYQFDLRSSGSEAVFGSEALTYVVRFYYPEEHMGDPAPPPPPVAQAAPLSAPMASSSPAAMPAAALSPIPQALSAPSLNYRYTFSGSDGIAPLKVYDDGKSTFFKFPSKVTPKIAVVTAQGEFVDMPGKRTKDGLVEVAAIAPRFKVTSGNQQVLVYNESNGAL